MNFMNLILWCHRIYLTIFLFVVILAGALLTIETEVVFLIAFAGFMVVSASFLILPIDLMLYSERFRKHRYSGFQYLPLVILFFAWETWTTAQDNDLSITQSLSRVIEAPEVGSGRSVTDSFDTGEEDRIIQNTPLAGDPIVEPIVIVEELSDYDLPWYCTLMLLALPFLVVYRHIQVERTAWVFTVHATSHLHISNLDTPQERRYVAEALFERSRTHRFRASMLLVLMVGMIGLGVQLYLTAGALISADAGPSPLEQTQSLHDRFVQKEQITLLEIGSDVLQRETILQAFKQLGNEQATIPSRTEYVDFGEHGCRTSRELIDFYFRLSATDRRDEAGMSACDNFPDISDLLSTDAALTRRIATQEGQLASLRDSQRSIQAYVSANLGELIKGNEPTESETTQQLIASGITRFGVLFVVIYLVQILVGIYRFSMRQAEFYEARANAILLIPGEGQDLGAWRDDLLAKDIDFGRPPRSPSEHITGIVGTLTRRRKPEDGSDNTGG